MLRIATLLKWLTCMVCLLGAAQSGAQSATGPANQSGIWWNPAEGGRGLTVQRNDAGVTFAAWFTYDKKGKATWYHMPNGRPDPANANIVVGDVFHPTGPSYTARIFDPAQVNNGAPVGQFRIEWSDDQNATFTFDVEGVHGSTSLKPYLYMKDNVKATQRQIVWNPKEGGWGLAVYYGPTTPESTATSPRTDFAVWFTYGDDHEATWFSVSDALHDDFPGFPIVFVDGNVFQYSGPPLASTFDAGAVHGTMLGYFDYQYPVSTQTVSGFRFLIQIPGGPGAGERHKDSLERFEF